MQRPRDRRGGERQDVHLTAQLLQPLLVRHAKTLLFVDDDEPEVLEFDVTLYQAVRADADVHGATGKAGQNFPLFLVRAEARQHFDLDRERAQTIAERVEVLLGEDRRWHQYRDLATILDGLERRSQRHFGLAEADVADQQAVHRPRRLHVCLNVSDGLFLIWCLFVWKAALQLQLPRRVDGIGMAFQRG